jgi:hypothetical protein
MNSLKLSVAEPDAMKNIYVEDGMKGTIIEANVKHKSSFCHSFIEYITRIDLGSSYMHYKLLYKDYLWITVLLPNFCVTIFVIDLDVHRIENANELQGKEVIMKYSSAGDIKVW